MTPRSSSDNALNKNDPASSAEMSTVVGNAQNKSMDLEAATGPPPKDAKKLPGLVRQFKHYRYLPESKTFIEVSGTGSETERALNMPVSPTSSSGGGPERGDPDHNAPSPTAAKTNGGNANAPGAGANGVVEANSSKPRTRRPIPEAVMRKKCTMSFLVAACLAITDVV